MMKAPGGTHGLGSLIVLIILKAGDENSVVAALFFRDFGEHAKDCSIERKENRGQESKHHCFLYPENMRKII